MGRAICISLLTSALICGQEQQQKASITVEQIVLQTIIDQQTHVDKQSHMLFGKALTQYLSALDTASFHKAFAQLPCRSKVMYLFDMNIEEYELFLSRFSDEQWLEMWRSLPADQQEHLPKSRTEQLMVIRDAYRAYCVANDTSWFGSVKEAAPYPSDIHCFKKACYGDPNVKYAPIYTERSYDREVFLDLFLKRKKFQLFNL